MIVLDTFSLIELMKGNSAVKQVTTEAEQNGEEIAISTVTSFELLQHMSHNKLLSQERTVKALVAATKLLLFDAEAADQAAKITGSLLRLGSRLMHLT